MTSTISAAATIPAQQPSVLGTGEDLSFRQETPDMRRWSQVDLHVQESVEIGRPVDDVFAYLSDPENSKEWSATVVDVRHDTPGPIRGVGDQFLLAQKFLGRNIEMPQEVVAFEPGQSYTLRSSGKPIPMTATWACAPSARGTRVTATFEGDAGSFFSLVGPLLERAVHRQVRSDLETLKDLLESREGSR